MYSFAHKRKNADQALVVGITLAYAVITWAVPFPHSHDCPAAHGATQTPCHSDSSCPACRYLAGSNSTEVHCDSSPVLKESQIPPESTCDSLVVITSLCEGSILLRGPPAAPLS